MENDDKKYILPAPKFQPPGCGFLVLITAIVVLLYFYFTCEPPIQVKEDNRIEIGPTIITQLQGKKQWCFREIAMQETSEIKGITGSLLKRYYGTLRLGVELDSINENSVKFDEANKTLHLKLPKIQILDENFIDESRTETLLENAWTKFNNKELKQCFNKAKEKMIKNNFTPRNIGLAEDQGISEVKRLVKSTGYLGKIEVEFMK